MQQWYVGNDNTIFTALLCPAAGRTFIDEHRAADTRARVQAVAWWGRG